MKKKWILLFILVLVAGLSLAEVLFLTDKKKEKKPELTIATSFYPVYIAVCNVAGEVPGAEIKNLTGNQTGCLHDYQLTTEDMRILEQADVFIINGGGMEAYMEEVLKNYPKLTVINAGEAVPLLEGNGAEEQNHEHEENAHVWMNPEYYKLQVESIESGLSALDSEHAPLYQKNASEYLAKLDTLIGRMQEVKEELSFGSVISFHDAFLYLADYMDIPVAQSVEMDEKSGFSTGQMVEIIQTIRDNSVRVLFAEKQYPGGIIDSIARETKTKVFVMDSLVTGSLDRDSYIRGMEKNLEILLEAVKLYE